MEKRCWICKRTEKEVREEFDCKGLSSKEVLAESSLAWHGLYCCIVCSDVIMNICAEAGFADTTQLYDTFEAVCDVLKKFAENTKTEIEARMEEVHERYEKLRAKRMKARALRRSEG